MRFGRLQLLSWIIIFVSSPAILAHEAPALPRSLRSLNGTWEFQRDGAREWKTVQLPAPFQSHEGTDFHGVGWYRKHIPAFTLPKDKRVLLHTQAAATFTEVWWNGVKIGSHLGGWTPFRFDVTDQVRAALPGKDHEIRLRVDEKVGHNTQGFLPVIAPHFGGIWQDVQLLIVPETYIDDLRVRAIGNPDTGTLEMLVPVEGTNARVRELEVEYRLRGDANAVKRTFRLDEDSKQSKDSEGVRLIVPVPHFLRWSPESPSLYEVTVRLLNDAVATRAAFRKIQATGDQLLLNGKPLCVRGVLNWGYCPPSLSPTPDEAKIHKDVELSQALGFNLMKFCLWIPPQRHLDWCDEHGFLAWIEYPTWHPQLTKPHQEALTREFDEFFAYDRNHPCVILRSLTCETGPSADVGVIRGLYDLAHQAIPGSLIEDDSSWIGWNRVSDFYDDHPYGNNHTWVATLGKLKDYIRQHGQKPLVLGEAIAADTWTDRASLLRRVGNDRPFWLPGFFNDGQRWLDRMNGLGSKRDLTQQLVEDSRRYALLMRKYQIETYRREVPHGGYVVSVIRDFPLAAMGLLDYLDRPKWEAKEWAWHGETMCLMKTEGDRRTFASGEQLQAKILLSHQGRLPLDARDLAVGVSGPIGGHEWSSKKSQYLQPGSLAEVQDLDNPVLEVQKPAPLEFKVLSFGESRSQAAAIHNGWRLWVIPRPGASFAKEVRIHPSLKAEIAKLFPGASREGSARTDETIVAAKFDLPLLESLQKGARVLLLPNGETNSLPLHDHWFLRGGPFLAEHPLWQKVPRDLLIETQSFDLAGPVVPDIAYFDEIDPIFMLWDNHDIKEVKTHGLLFETRVGKGRLLVSALRHHGATNAVGRWLLQLLLEHLATGPQPKHAFKPETIARIKEKIVEQKVELVRLPWRFHPDPDNEGVRQGWHTTRQDVDRDWKTIRIGQYWEQQGYPDLDGWAWYRLTLSVPSSMKDHEVYLTFEGVDDYYELFVNGKLLGKGGDLEKRVNALEEHRSYRLTDLVRPGEACVIAVRVNDFQGAGGIYRPVTLGTVPYIGKGEVLR